MHTVHSAILKINPTDEYMFQDSYSELLNIINILMIVQFRWLGLVSCCPYNKSDFPKQFARGLWSSRRIYQAKTQANRGVKVIRLKG